MSEILTLPPTRIRIDLDASHAGPIIAAILGRVLTDAGAQVTVTRSDTRDDMTRLADKKVPSLKGLHVVIDRVTWVRPEEAARWEDSK